MKTRGFGRRGAAACAMALAIALVGLGGGAEAFDELIPTKIGLIKFGGTPAVGKLYKLVSKPLGLPLFSLPSASPVGTGGTLAVAVGPGTLICSLAAQAYDGTEGWKELGNPAGSKGYIYINKSAPGGAAGPCKTVIVKEKVIKVLSKGTGGLPVPLGTGLNPDTSTRLALGKDNYCALAVDYFREIAGKLIKAKDQGQPLSCPPPLDHYRAYVAGGPDAPQVALEDQFQKQAVDLGPVLAFMPPVRKNDEPIFDPAPHLTCYGIPEGRFEASVEVRNQFGLQSLSVGNPVALCVPTEKYPEPPGTPLLRDHYKCYQAAGAPPSDVLVNLADQFQGQQGVQVLEPYSFCAPVDKNGEGILNAFEHLTCYTTFPPGIPPGIIPVRNQFHELEVLGVGEPLGLCVPSGKLSIVTTTTTTTQPTTTITTTTTTTTQPPTTITTTTSTTTTTIPTLCCEFPPGPDYPGLIPACLDTFAGHADQKCFFLAGHLVPGVCDPMWERCVEDEVPPSDVCCQCPVASPPFPNPQFCFETVVDHVQAKCLFPCVVVPGARCDPLTETCR